MYFCGKGVIGGLESLKLDEGRVLENHRGMDRRRRKDFGNKTQPVKNQRRKKKDRSSTLKVAQHRMERGEPLAQRCGAVTRSTASGTDLKPRRPAHVFAYERCDTDTVVEEVRLEGEAGDGQKIMQAGKHERTWIERLMTRTTWVREAPEFLKRNGDSQEIGARTSTVKNCGA
ncbi:hypothetical protein C8R44DRAFT_733178 [Mycena epipterygia]|nr:hypothetical protein C8R44DRAFT_733178 [Mycena epipterygia]